MRIECSLAVVVLLAPLACSSSDGTTSASSGASSSASSSSSGGDGGHGGGDAGPSEPAKPPDLVTYVDGDPADAAVTPKGPGLILMGGGPDVDAAFTWWKPIVNGGDVVVLRTSGSNGYNSYLYQQIGGVDSVETMLVTTPALADSDYVTWKIRHAEGIFIAGGDQATYLKAWKGHGVQAALMDAWARGAVIGGTSAGCDVLGEFAFAAYNDTVYSNEALADPYNTFMTMERDFLALPPLAGAITDTHFVERDRMGRLVAFVGRVLADGWSKTGKARGIGVDEQTAIVVDSQGQGSVIGSGAAYLIEATAPPAVCQAGKPLEFSGLALRKLSAGDTVALPSGMTAAPAQALAASGGKLIPQSPY